MRAIALWVVAVVSWLPSGCGPSGESDCRVQVVATSEGFVAEDSCGRASAELRPYAIIDGALYGGGDLGVVSARVAADKSFQVGFEALRQVDVEGLALGGRLDLPGATAWLSNGFQSWSQSGMVAIGPEPAEADRMRAVTAVGDAEVLRTGEELSWWHTWVGGGEMILLAGALGAERFKPWLQVFTDEEGVLQLWLISGAAGERISLATGDAVFSDPWYLNLGTDLASLGTDYGKHLPGRHRDGLPPAEAGWNSWYQLWNSVDAAAVEANASLATPIIEAAIGTGRTLRIVIDDGWQRAWGDWEPNQKFPGGLDGLAGSLHARGFEVGIWLAPLLVEENLPLVADHPDWFVGGVVYDHAVQGPMRVVDVTKPEAAAHLSQAIERIVSWGYDLLKIDFLFAGTWEGDRFEAVTGMQAYARALSLIREAAGPDTQLLAVGAPPVASFPYVDAWRIGGDIALDPIGPSWHFAVNQARSISSRWPCCHAVLCDADPPILRDMTRDEVESGCWVVALAGGALFLSDDLRTLPVERNSWLPSPAALAAISGQPSVPLDPFPAEPPVQLVSPFNDLLLGANSHVLPLRWRLPSGHTVIFNVGEQAIRKAGQTIPARGAALLDP